MRLVEIQIWDVAASMVFYLLLSVVPILVAAVSTVSLIGLEDPAIDTAVALAAEIFPSIPVQVVEGALHGVAGTGGGVVGLVLGLVGSLIAASNSVASFHRAIHRIYDTREGRPFLVFRAVIAVETLVMIVLGVVTLLIVVVGGELSVRIGAAVGLPDTAALTWNALKWPLLLLVLILGVSSAYHRGPNARLPAYRPITLGSAAAVLVLFASALVIGWLAGNLGRFDVVLSTLSVIIASLVLLWLSMYVVVGGAALDAEILRARQLALGLPAWDKIQLPTRTRHTLLFLENDAARTEALSRIVVDAVHDGEPVRVRPTPWLAEAESGLAIDEPPRTQRNRFQIWFSRRRIPPTSRH